MSKGFGNEVDITAHKTECCKNCCKTNSLNINIQTNWEYLQYFSTWQHHWESIYNKLFVKLQKYRWNTQKSLSCHCSFVFQIKSFISIGCIALLPSWSDDIFWFGKLCKRLQELITIRQQSLIALPVSCCNLCTSLYAQLSV